MAHTITCKYKFQSDYDFQFKNEILYFALDTDLDAACQGWAVVVAGAVAGVEGRQQAQQSYVSD